jgi:hypothetical protein
MSVIKVNSVNNVTKVTSKNEIVKINNVNNVNTIINAGVGYLSIDFVSGDTTLEIGVVPVNKMISHTILEVTTSGAGTCNIGTAISQGLLMTVNENDLSVANQYLVFNNIQTTTNETFNIYFTNNTSAGTVTIYYN